jgi:transcriptional regulator with XRE-family HTH domain
MNNNNLKTTVSNKLKECRLKAGLSQFDVTLRMVFRSKDRISKWEKGTRLPSLINLFKPSEIYKVTYKELYPEVMEEILRSQIQPLNLPRE